MTKQRKPPKQLLIPGFPAKITKLVEGESDRGAILILAAYLDELLCDLIRAACISDIAADDLLDLRRPAGDFASRISLCGALGLIHSTEVAGLEAVRKIRNGAAHFDKTGRGFDVLFDADSTIDQVANLARAVNISIPSRESAAVKHTFIVSARFLAVRIIFRAAVVERPGVPPTLKDVANAFRAHVKGTPQGDRLQEMEAAIRGGDLEGLTAYWKDMAAKLQARLNTQGGNDSDT
jgi:hypothetical protein